MAWKRLFFLVTHLLSPCLGLSTPLDLTSHFNGKAASTGVNDTAADFDGSGRAYPVEFLPKGGSNFSYEGIDFVIPPFDDSNALDFIRSDAQTLNISGGNVAYQSVHALAASVWTPSSYAQG